MKRAAIYAMAAAVLLSAAAGGAAAQEGGEADAGISLDLSPPIRESLKRTMREHLEALDGIVAALADEDYEKASAIARRELGFAKHHEVMQREKGATFPEKYQELAMDHHQAAEELAKAIDDKQMKAILQKLDQTMKACVACHRAYKL